MLHRDRIALKDKKLLALNRELNRLHQAQWNAPIIPLATPYQRGWTKRYALRDDITRRREAPDLRVVLKHFNTTIHSMSRDFINSKGQPLLHDLKIIPKREFESYNWPPKLTKWVTLGFWRLRTPYYQYPNTVEGYKLAFPHYFLVADIQPYIITHQRVIYPEIEQRIAEIRNKFTRDNHWCRLDRYIYGSSKGGKDYRANSETQRQINIVYGLDPDEY